MEGYTPSAQGGRYFGRALFGPDLVPCIAAARAGRLVPVLTGRCSVRSFGARRRFESHSLRDIFRPPTSLGDADSPSESAGWPVS